MKKIFFKFSLACMALYLLATGCTKKLDEAYYNPNADTRVPVEQLLPPIIASMAANSAGHGPYNDYRYLGQYIQNWQYANTGSLYDRMGPRNPAYGSTAADQTASIFRVHYYDLGQNLQNMIKWSEEEKKWDCVGVGKAILAWSWLELTDVQGEAILKDAFNSGLITFKYDTQEDVYNYVRTLCGEALTYLNKTGDGVNPNNLAVSDAYFYGGDLNKWKKFVYGIMARSYNHLSNKPSVFKADSVIYYCNLSLSAPADNAMVKFAYVTGGLSGSANFFGPLRSNLGGTTDGSTTAIRQSAYIANLLSGANSAFTGVTDPRAIYLLRKNKDSTYKGLSPNKGTTVIPANERPESFWGVSQTNGIVNTAPPNDANCRFIFRNAAPLPVMTVAEIQFMKAEAAYRKGDKGTALDAYKQGIAAHIDMLTTYYNTNVPTAELITGQKKADFLANPLVVPASAAGLTMTMIMMQKYIALWGIGVTETWVDMRRFHYIDSYEGKQVYADFVPPAGTDLWPANNSKLVYRVYPRYNSETVWNIEELKRIGADKEDFHTTQPWFVNP